MQDVLATFGRIVRSKLTEVDAFGLLHAVFEALPTARLTSYMPMVFSILFTRMQNLKTPRFTKLFLTFTCLLAGKHGGSVLIAAVDSIQVTLVPLFFLLLLFLITLLADIVALQK